MTTATKITPILLEIEWGFRVKTCLQEIFDYSYYTKLEYVCNLT